MRRTPEIWRLVDGELAVSRGHHALASSDDR